MNAREWVGALILPAVLATSTASAAGLVTVGWIERVKLGAEGITVEAKLDTGALTSSLHAADLRWSSRADGDWVEFDVIGADGVHARFKRKVVRISRVKRASGGVTERPVVLMGLCLGSHYRVTEVNLTDRSGFDYELLIGRRFLAHYFAVDSSRLYTVKAACADNGKR